MFRICNISLIHANLHTTFGGKMNKKKVQTRTLTYGNKCTTQMKEKNLTTLFTELTSESLTEP